MAIDVTCCPYKMQQIHWLIYGSTHSDWFREITLLSNLIRGRSSSTRLPLKKKPQLRTNQNARSTEFITLKKIYGNFLGSKSLQCPCKTVWSQCMKDTATAPLGRSASLAPGLVNPRHITLAPLKRNLIAPLSTCWCGRITGSMIARSNKLSWFDASLV